MNRTLRKRMGIFTGKGTESAQDFELERLYCPGFQIRLLSERYFLYIVFDFSRLVLTHVCYLILSTSAQSVPSWLW